MKKYIKDIWKYLIVAALFVVFLGTTYLFELFIEGTFPSDFRAHIISAINGKGYSLMHLILKLCNKVSEHPLITAYAMGIIILATVYAIYCFMSLILRKNGTQANKYSVLALSITGVSLCGIYIPYFYPHFYVASTSLTQPWHNTTYILMRMLGYLTLIAYFYLVRHYQEEGCLKWYIAFTVLLSLSNYAKPNFFLGFSPAMLAVLVYDLFKSKGKQLKNIIRFGSCVLISMPVLFLQAGFIYDGTDKSSVIFSLDRFLKLYSGTEWIWAAVSNLLFPIIVTAVMISVRKKEAELDMSCLIQTWLMYFISYAEMLFLAETGPRATHGNFSWGIYFFTGVLYIVCLAEWVSMYKKQLLSKRSIVLYIGSAIYLINAATGVWYVMSLIKGQPYLR